MGVLRWSITMAMALPAATAWPAQPWVEQCIRETGEAGWTQTSGGMAPCRSMTKFLQPLIQDMPPSKIAWAWTGKGPVTVVDGARVDSGTDTADGRPRWYAAVVGVVTDTRIEDEEVVERTWDHRLVFIRIDGGKLKIVKVFEPPESYLPGRSEDLNGYEFHCVPTSFEQQPLVVLQHRAPYNSGESTEYVVYRLTGGLRGVEKVCSVSGGWGGSLGSPRVSLAMDFSGMISGTARQFTIYTQTSDTYAYPSCERAVVAWNGWRYTTTRESADLTPGSPTSAKPRPSDLDPRIPWIDSIGMPQSGGPECLVPAEKLDIAGPNGGRVQQIHVSSGQLAAIIARGNQSILASMANPLTVGTGAPARCEVPLAENQALCSMRIGDGLVVVLPNRSAGASFAVVYDAASCKEVNRIEDPIFKSKEYVECDVIDGLLRCQERTSRGASKSFRISEARGIPRDLSHLLHGRVVRPYADQAAGTRWDGGELEMTMAPNDAVEDPVLMRELTEKASRWNRKALQVRDLPGWGAWSRTETGRRLRPWGVQVSGTGTSAWVYCQLENPLELEGELIPNDHRAEWSLLARFDETGRMLSWLICEDREPDWVVASDDAVIVPSRLDNRVQTVWRVQR